MKRRKATPHPGTVSKLITSVCAISICLVLAACSRPTDEQTVATPVATPAGVAAATQPVEATQPAETQIAVETATPTGPEMDATKAAYMDWPIHEWETEVAQGTHVAPSPIVVPTSGPVMTPVLGIHTDCVQGDSLYKFGGCWSGLQ